MRAVATAPSAEGETTRQRNLESASNTDQVESPVIAQQSQIGRQSLRWNQRCALPAPTDLRPVLLVVFNLDCVFFITFFFPAPFLRLGWPIVVFTDAEWPFPPSLGPERGQGACQGPYQEQTRLATPPQTSRVRSGPGVLLACARTESYCGKRPRSRRRQATRASRTVLSRKKKRYEKHPCIRIAD